MKIIKILTVSMVSLLVIGTSPLQAEVPHALLPVSTNQPLIDICGKALVKGICFGAKALFRGACFGAIQVKKHPFIALGSLLIMSSGCILRKCLHRPLIFKNITSRELASCSYCKKGILHVCKVFDHGEIGMFIHGSRERIFRTKKDFSKAKIAVENCPESQFGETPLFVLDVTVRTDEGQGRSILNLGRTQDGKVNLRCFRDKTSEILLTI